MRFEPKLLDKPLTPIEALEWQSGLAWYVSTHADAIINRQFRGRLKEMGDDKRRQHKEKLLWLATEISKAELLLWDRPMYDFAWDGQTLFTGFQIPNDLLSRQPELWLRNYDATSDWSLPDNMPDGNSGCFQASLLLPDIEHGLLAGWDISLFTQGPLIIPRNYTFVPGQKFPDTIDECDMSICVMAQIEFLKSPIVISEKESLPRHVRRQAKRENAHEPIVRIIHLRRTEKKQGPGGSEGQGGGIDYSCQWLVRPHWRNQYHPSTNDHKPVFIDAHIKGPEDKPFKPPKDYVFKVDR